MGRLLDLALLSALREVALTAAEEGFGQDPQARLGGRSEEKPDPVKFMGRCKDGTPQAGAQGQLGEALPAGLLCLVSAPLSEHRPRHPAPQYCALPTLGSNPEESPSWLFVLKRTPPPE